VANLQDLRREGHRARRGDGVARGSAKIATVTLLLRVYKHGLFSDFFLFFLLRLCPRKAHFISKQKKQQSKVLFLALCLNLIKFTSTSKFAIIIIILVTKPINSLQRLKSQKSFGDRVRSQFTTKKLFSQPCAIPILFPISLLYL
jgi:hypothetical protein